MKLIFRFRFHDTTLPFNDKETSLIQGKEDVVRQNKMVGSHGFPTWRATSELADQITNQQRATERF
jgi:hypothetical protein